jgi:peptide/nickel transport system ATP-binding protein
MSALSINKLIINDINDKKLVDLFNQTGEPLNIQSSLALVGQSGSGKSLTLKTILNMLPSNLSKSFEYKSDFELSLENTSFIPQNPFTSLSPMTKIKKQFFAEEEKIDELLKLVELDTELKNRFPVQLSGGQLQRIIIAIALSKNPKLLLLDEPTTALDEKSKTTIIDLLKKLQEKMGFLMVFVSHDIDSIENICKDIAILKNGTIVERGELKKVLKDPKDEYTKKLISSSFSQRDFRI